MAKKGRWVVRLADPDQRYRARFYLTQDAERGDLYGGLAEATRFSRLRDASEAAVRCGPKMWTELGCWAVPVEVPARPERDTAVKTYPRCTACGKTGHNRQTCAPLVAWRKEGGRCVLCRDVAFSEAAVFWAKNMHVLGFGHGKCVAKWEASGARHRDLVAWVVREVRDA